MGIAAGFPAVFDPLPGCVVTCTPGGFVYICAALYSVALTGTHIVEIDS